MLLAKLILLILLMYSGKTHLNSQQDTHNSKQNLLRFVSTSPTHHKLKTGYYVLDDRCCSYYQQYS
jgi:hypothetical protein